MSMITVFRFAFKYKYREKLLGEGLKWEDNVHSRHCDFSDRREWD